VYGAQDFISQLSGFTVQTRYQCPIVLLGWLGEHNRSTGRINSLTDVEIDRAINPPSIPLFDDFKSAAKNVSVLPTVSISIALGPRNNLLSYLYSFRPSLRARCRAKVRLLPLSLLLQHRQLRRRAPLLPPLRAALRPLPLHRRPTKVPSLGVRWEVHWR
jgi:hypothetical protein